MLAHKIPQRTAPGLEPLCEEERWTAWVGNNNFEGSDFLLTKPSNAAAMRLPLAPVDGGIHPWALGSRLPQSQLWMCRLACISKIPGVMGY